MQIKEKPKKYKYNLRKFLDSLSVDSSRVKEFEELANLIKTANTYKISEFWRLQTNVPLLRIISQGNELIGYVLYLADIGEIQHGMADVFYKGIISSSLNITDNTPTASIINAEVDKIVIISLGGYASLIKPNIY